MSEAAAIGPLEEALRALKDQIDADDALLARMAVGAAAPGLAREAELAARIAALAPPGRGAAARIAAEPGAIAAVRELHAAALRHQEIVATARCVLEGVVRRLGTHRAASGASSLAVDRSV
jgi:hypothetical protein